ncbi:MAG: recombinase family protein [Clostridiales bacterium]|nr:recombinase family protein [Clostridiales bacterium]
MWNEPERSKASALPSGTVRAAIYCRLSKDDELQGESASIANQRSMLQDYCEKQGWEVIAVYQDDGFTGLSMDRPDFQRMLKAAEARMINLVITKDLSRLSRNYLEAGKMIEEFFPRHGVRYIALNDGIDTMLDNNDIAPFKNILNEFYSRDISKKVHASYYLKATRGDFTGCVAPFGYVKDPECKNHLLIDEETAPIVRQIFDYALEGRGPGYIRRRLEMDEIPCPTWWNRQRGIRNHFTKWELADPDNGRYLWDDSVLKDMLINPVYMGCMASQKKNYRFKIGTIGEKKPEDWIVVEETHEAIVTAEEFEIVQKKLKARQRPRDDGNFSLFAGLIKCGECGKALTIRKTNAKQPKDIYACWTYNRYGKHHCTQHRIEYDVLYDMVLSKIQECAAAALADDKEVLDQLSKSFRSEQEDQLQAISRQVAKDTERLSLLDRMVVKLYEDMIAGRISEANFNLMMKKAQDEQVELTDRVKYNKKLLTDQNKLTRDNQQWLDMIREYADIQELDAETLQKLIREITVHEDIDEDGTRNITAEIRFNLKPLPEPMGGSEPTTE